MDDQHVLRAWLEAQEHGSMAALATVIRTQGSMPRHAGRKMLVRPNGEIVGTVGGGAMESRVVQDAQAAMLDGQPRVVAYTLNDLGAGAPTVCGVTAENFIVPLNN